jgi:hypothetical protein
MDGRKVLAFELSYFGSGTIIEKWYECGNAEAITI